LIQGITVILNTFDKPFAHFSALIHFLGANVTVISPLVNSLQAISISAGLGVADGKYNNKSDKR
jgi:hypothetical protein